MKITAITYEEMRKGCWDPKARLEDMDANWTEAQMCFPSFPRFCGQTFLEADDKDLALLCVKAYNDWMVDEWCGDSDGRLIPLIIIPLWDADLAAAEIRPQRRPWRAGHLLLARSRRTSGCRRSTPAEWDPFFDACAETGVVVNMHIGSSSKMPSTSADAPPAVGSTLTFGNAMSSMVDFLMSGVLVALPEAHAGLQRGPDRLDPLHPRAGRQGLGGEPGLERRLRRRSPSRRRPTTTARSTAASSTTSTGSPPDSLAKCGAGQHHVRDRLPALRQHLAAQPEVGQKLMGHLDDDTVRKLVRGNAIRMLDLPFAP